MTVSSASPINVTAKRSWVPHHKLSVEQVKAIKLEFTDYRHSITAMARRYEISARELYRIRDGQIWKDVQPDLPPEVTVEADEAQRLQKKGWRLHVQQPFLPKVVMIRPEMEL